MTKKHKIPESNWRSFSIPSIVAVLCALLSFKSGAIMGTIFALFAIIFGILGITLAISSKVRGGIISTLAIIGGAIGIIAAVFKMILWLF